MTPQQHKAEAESLIKSQRDVIIQMTSELNEGEFVTQRQFDNVFRAIEALTSIAQVHATLATVPVRPDFTNMGPG